MSQNELLFHAYGGPDDGALVSVMPGVSTHWTHRKVLAPFVHPDSPAPTVPRFNYILVNSPDGGNAFVPQDDDDLCEAINLATEERARAALEAEGTRRGLNF